ncbi:MAG TPA: ABC transporter ATP-binding protein [Thermoanaerobaculia bacterium]
MSTEPMLAARGLHAWYGESHVLHGIDFEVHEGELVTLLGRNGAGRTSILKAILGLTDRREGSIRVRGREVIGLPSHRIARLGVGYCPEERGIYANLTVEENLALLPTLGPGGMSADELHQMFPNLRERRRSRGTHLSGGEQQMLALARILRTGARILLLDEITEGLAPVIVQALGHALAALKARGLTMILVESNFRFAAPLAQKHFVIEHGRVASVLRSDELESKADVLKEYLAV